MRALMIAFPLMLIAAPATAQRPVPQLPPQLTDPAMGEKMGRMAGALTRALMDIKVGEFKAIAEGREATPAERRQTVRDLAGGPETERRIEQQVTAAGPAMQRGMQALANALPKMMEAMEGVVAEIDRSTANIPQPGYPKR